MVNLPISTAPAEEPARIDRRLLGYNEVSDREAAYYCFDIPDLGLRIFFRSSHFRMRDVVDAHKRELLLPELGIATGCNICTKRKKEPSPVPLHMG